MFIVGFTGKARAGKDTAGRFLFDKYGFATYAMAHPLKAMLGAIGFPPEKFQTTEEKEAIIPSLGVSYRHLAQTLGTDWMRDKVNPQGWVLLAKNAFDYTRTLGSCPGLAITDVRFDNEAQMVREQGGLVVHILANRDSGLQGATKNHVSEAGVAFVAGDKIIYNYGTEDDYRVSLAAAFDPMFARA